MDKIRSQNQVIIRATREQKAQQDGWKYSVLVQDIILN